MNIILARFCARSNIELGITELYLVPVLASRRSDINFNFENYLICYTFLFRRWKSLSSEDKEKYKEKAKAAKTENFEVNYKFEKLTVDINS
jgi:hypothetical protein